MCDTSWSLSLFASYRVGTMPFSCKLPGRKVETWNPQSNWPVMLYRKTRVSQGKLAGAPGFRSQETNSAALMLALGRNRALGDGVLLESTRHSPHQWVQSAWCSIIAFAQCESGQESCLVVAIKAITSNRWAARLTCVTKASHHVDHYICSRGIVPSEW